MSARIDLLDMARGFALLAMTVFHFAFDLELFGLQERGFIAQPHWKYFARTIATSFLFLVGYSLFIAHGGGVRWAEWRWRMVKLVLAALVITLATWFTIPNQFIFFGILHQIAFASVAGLLFLKVPVTVSVLAALVVFALGQSFDTALLGHPAWWWTGLSQVVPISSDYVPVFPWFSAVLLGIAVAKLSVAEGWNDRMASLRFDSTLAGALKFIGRHSLVYYLLHQPVMIVGLSAAIALSAHKPW